MALGAELELEFYPGGDGEPSKDSKRGKGVIVSHPGKKICLTLSPLFPITSRSWRVLSGRC